jgi:hypothetical protein
MRSLVGYRSICQVSRIYLPPVYLNQHGGGRSLLFSLQVITAYSLAILPERYIYIYIYDRRLRHKLQIESSKFYYIWRRTVQYILTIQKGMLQRTILQRTIIMNKIRMLRRPQTLQRKNAITNSFMNKISMLRRTMVLQRTRRNTLGRRSTIVRMKCQVFPL